MEKFKQIQNTTDPARRSLLIEKEKMKIKRLSQMGGKEISVEVIVLIFKAVDYLIPGPIIQHEVLGSYSQKDLNTFR